MTRVSKKKTKTKHLTLPWGLAATKEVFLEEAACDPIPEVSINKRSVCSPTTKDKEDRLGKEHSGQIQRSGKMRMSNESSNSKQFSQAVEYVLVKRNRNGRPRNEKRKLKE